MRGGRGYDQQRRRACAYGLTWASASHASPVGGWVTAVSDKGGIFQAWAGEYYGSRCQAVTA